MATVLWEGVVRSLVLCVVLDRSLFVLFLLAIALSVLRLADSDYPIGIYKLFFSLILQFTISDYSIGIFNRNEDIKCCAPDELLE